MDKQLKILNEFLRSDVQLMDPTSKEEKIKFLMDPVARQRLYDQYPQCTLPIKYLNADNVQPYFFICSRNGIKDADMIKFAIKTCEKLEAMKNIDQDHLAMIKKKLMMMRSRYDKPIPTPYENSYRKSRSTMRLNNIIRGLRSIRNPNENKED